jgi:hypothetical protein
MKGCTIPARTRKKLLRNGKLFLLPKSNCYKLRGDEKHVLSKAHSEGSLHRHKEKASQKWEAFLVFEWQKLGYWAWQHKTSKVYAH